MMPRLRWWRCFKAVKSEVLPRMRSIVSRRVRSGLTSAHRVRRQPDAKRAGRGREERNSKVRQIGASWWWENCGVIHDRDRDAVINLKTLWRARL